MARGDYGHQPWGLQQLGGLVGRCDTGEQVEVLDIGRPDGRLERQVGAQQLP
jgi:hypothetical protein